MHRETYVNRKIPLNAKLSILIERVTNLKESIENIEHFAKIQHAANGLGAHANSIGAGFEDDLDMGFKVENEAPFGSLARSSMVKNRTDM